MGRQDGAAMKEEGGKDSELSFLRSLFPVQFGLRPKGFEESFGKIVTVSEVAPIISFGFSQKAGFDHIEDNFAEVAAVLNTPFNENGRGHGAELLEGKLPDAFEQFLAGYVAELPAIFLDDEFLGKIEGLADEQIRLAGIPRVIGENRLERFIKIYLLHFKIEDGAGAQPYPCSRFGRQSGRRRRVRRPIEFHAPAY